MTKTECHFCEKGYDRGVNGNHWTGSEYVRVNLCLDCYHAGRLERAPRRPRQPRQRVGLYGDFAYLAAFNGIATDGTGRKVR